MATITVTPNHACDVGDSTKMFILTKPSEQHQKNTQIATTEAPEATNKRDKKKIQKQNYNSDESITVRSNYICICSFAAF